MIIYITYIDPDFPRTHPVLYWIILVVSLLIIFCSILYLPYTVYARAFRKKAEKRPTGHKSKQKPGGPPHNNNSDPYMQQSTNDKKKSTSKKTTSKKATEDQEKEKEKKLRKKQANARYREKLKNDKTVDENGLTRLDKVKENTKASSARYREKLKNDTTVDENGLTRQDKHKAAIYKHREGLKNDTTVDENGLTRLDKKRANHRKTNNKYGKSEKGKQTRNIWTILSRPSRYQ